MQDNNVKFDQFCLAVRHKWRLFWSASNRITEGCCWYCCAIFDRAFQSFTVHRVCSRNLQGSIHHTTSQEFLHAPIGCHILRSELLLTSSLEVAGSDCSEAAVDLSRYVTADATAAVCLSTTPLNRDCRHESARPYRTFCLRSTTAGDSENARVENAGVENSGAGCRGGKCTSGKAGVYSKGRPTATDELSR